MKKVISFSLWGADPKYCVGALQNAKLAKSIYPGWETWFYCASTVPKSIVEEIQRLNGVIIPKNEIGDWTSTFWRFEPISHPDVEVMISRDTDSRLGERERAAVEEWLKSPHLFHVMRDHPAHTVPILAGMWGAKKPILGDMQHLIRSYSKADADTKQSDQIFLSEVIWPRVAYSTKTHDEFFAKMKFPTSRVDGDFVGQVFDEKEAPNELFRQSLLESIR